MNFFDEKFAIHPHIFNQLFQSSELRLLTLY